MYNDIYHIYIYMYVCNDIYNTIVTINISI